MAHWKAAILRKPVDETKTMEGILSQSDHVVAHYNVVEDEFPEGVNLVIRWGCTANVPHEHRILNLAGPIHQVYDKGNFRLKLYHAGLTVPTVVNDYSCGHFPCIVRPIHHEKGRNLYFCNTPFEVSEAAKEIGGDYYVSKYEPKTAEFRVYMGCSGCSKDSQELRGHCLELLRRKRRGCLPEYSLE